MSIETETIERVDTDTKIEPPKFYKVILHNDDSTTMDFVIEVLTRLFHRPFDEAMDIMLAIHETGEGIAGSPYTKEIAEQKVEETIAFSRANSFPLVASYDKLL